MLINRDVVGRTWDTGTHQWSSTDALVYALGVMASTVRDVAAGDVLATTTTSIFVRGGGFGGERGSSGPWPMPSGSADETIREVR